MSVKKPERGRRYTSDQLAALGNTAVELYVNQRYSIREICRATGYSYGTVHRVLVVIRGVQMRKRGVNN